MSSRTAYATQMSALRTCADSLYFRDPYLCANDVLQTTPSSNFSDELQEIRMHGREIVALISKSTKSIRVDDLETICQSLHRIANRTDERRNVLNYSIRRVPEMKKNCVILSEPDIDLRKIRSEGIEEAVEKILERAQPKQACLGFFYKSSILEVPTKDWPSAAKLMQEELRKIDLKRCKKIASDYESSSKEIRHLAEQLKQVL